jgi:ubiquitin thioesterase OTU1
MDSGIPIRRYVDADNSCLFSSIAYLINRQDFNETSSIAFRNMIVEYLCNNEFEESLLDLPKNEYINSIANPTKWGGGIEIKIFTEILKVEIAIVDVQTNRIDLFGQDKNYENRIYILYNGIHYDPLVINFDENADSDSDLTIFNTNENDIMELFKNYVQKFKDDGDFVDISKMFSLECVDCNEKFLNEETANSHAKNKDHWTFKQI